MLKDQQMGWPRGGREGIIGHANLALLASKKIFLSLSSKTQDNQNDPGFDLAGLCPTEMSINISQIFVPCTEQTMFSISCELLIPTIFWPH